MFFASDPQKILKKQTGVTVGTFDGVHRGHVLVAESLRKACAERGLVPLVITFEPHPLAVVAPDRAPLLLEDPEERETRLKEIGVEVEVVGFNEKLRSLTVDEWFGILRRDYNAVFMLIGYDNSFGCDGKGKDMDYYIETGRRHGIEVMIADELEGVSSSMIRKAVAEGRMDDASRMLGRRYSVEGKVIHGRAVGRGLGFPTANVEIDRGRLMPPRGVYAADVETVDGRIYRSVVNIGKAPTFSDSIPLTLEAHLLGFNGNLYGENIKVNFIKKLRDEKKFANLDELIGAITDDVSNAVKIDHTDEFNSQPGHVG